MTRMSRFGMNDEVAWKQHQKEVRNAATRRYRAKHKIKQIVCTDQMHHILTSGLLGGSIKESMDRLSDIVISKFPQLRLAPDSVKNIQVSETPVVKWMDGKEGN